MLVPFLLLVARVLRALTPQDCVAWVKQTGTIDGGPV